MKRLLAIDIGNTNTALGFFNKNSLLKKSSVKTERISIEMLKKDIASYKPEEIIVCSVVPQATKRILKILKGLTGKKAQVIGKEIVVPIINRYRKPQEVGQDRLINAFAAIQIYGTPAVIIDFGTAVTFDIVSKQKEYLGGMILPGLNISLEALSKRTALLPKVKLSKPKDFIGRDTRNSMLSGIVFGFSSLTDELITRIKKIVGKRAVSILTGGNSKLIFDYCRNLDIKDEDLTLKGIAMLKNKKNT